MENQTPSRVSASTVATIGLIGFVLGFLLGGLTYKRFSSSFELPVVAIQADTVIVRDTIRLEIPTPTSNGEIRRDTVWLQKKTADSTNLESDSTTPVDTSNDREGVRLEPDGSITIPIEQKEYKTEEYKALIEGWRPKLVSMEVYPKTTTITNTVTRLQKPRWSVTGGLGAGYAPNIGLYPNIGIVAGFVLWSK